jgi:general transcription factor 3C polypeptide 3 (transcription factor C subunit 4)
VVSNSNNGFTSSCRFPPFPAGSDKQYALLKGRYEGIQEADAIIATTQDAAIFYQTPRFQTITHLVQIAYALHKTSIPDLVAHTKKLATRHQFKSDPLRLYYLVLGTGREGAEQFRAAMDQKYFLRTIKAMDSVLTGEEIVGQAAVVEGGGRLEKANPVLLILYGHRLAAGGSFLPAQSTSPQKIIPCDPVFGTDW